MEEVPRPGETVGRYIIERVLGAGGMGIVFAARDPDLDRLVAVKLLRAGGPDRAEARPRLLREARAMAKLSHPNVIAVHEVGSDGPRDFVAMELIDGQNVAEWLSRPRSRAEVLRVLLAAGRGLAAAHAAGLVHRDFKPHNVLIGRGDRVVVTDFGLARAFDELHAAPAVPTLPDHVVALDETLDAVPAARPVSSRTTAGSLSGTLTRTGALLGTPAYMAPEQFAGQSAGPAADQFAFAVALWEGLDGARPFLGGTLIELQRAVEGGVAQGGASIPRRFRRVLERGLAKDPAARWSSIDAMLAALEAGVRAPRRNASIGAGVVLLGAAVGCFFLLDRPGARARTPSACPPADRRLAEAWPPALADRLDAQFGDSPSWPAVRAALGEFRSHWTTSWQASCAAPDEPHFHGRVACLEAALDEYGALAVSLGDGSPELLGGFEHETLLPSPDGCLDGTRVGFPALPDDLDLRAEVARIHRDLRVARLLAHDGRRDEARAAIEAAVAAASAVRDRYLPIHAEAMEAQATVHEVLGEFAIAESLYEQAAEEAEEAGHLPVRAMSLLGQLSLLTARSSDGVAIRKLADQTRAAIKRAGDDPVLRAGVDVQLADLMAREGDLDGAIDRAEAARQVMVRVGDVRRIGVFTQSLVQYLVLRAGPGDAARAEALLHDALVATAAVFGDQHPGTQGLAFALAWQRWANGDLDGAHQLFTALVAPALAMSDGTVRVTGRVVDGSGAPVAGADVVGGPRVVGDPGALSLPAGAVPDASASRTVTGADGGFELDLPPASIVVAGASGDVATPALAVPGVVLTLHAPGRLAGNLRVTGEVTGDDRASALARHVARRRVVLDTGEGRYRILAPVSSSDRWVLESMPPGEYVVVGDLTTALGDTIETRRPMSVGSMGMEQLDLAIDRGGVVVDVVVRGVTTPSATVHLTAGGTEHSGDAEPVGAADETEPGRALYRPGDLHVRLSSVPAGPVKACVDPATCVDATISASPGVQVIVVEVR